MRYFPVLLLLICLTSSSLSCSGAYFCEHAFYACAYGEGWLSHGLPETPHEPPSSEPGTVTEIVLARVALGQCKDFEHRCVSDRDRAASLAKGLDPKKEDRQFKRDWEEEPPFDIMVGNKLVGHRRRPPPLERGAQSSGRYDSVSGTEGDLAWTAHPDDRFRHFGAKYGRQYVTFSTDQAYPEFVLQLERLDDDEAASAVAAGVEDMETRTRGGAPSDGEEELAHIARWREQRRREFRQSFLVDNTGAGAPVPDLECLGEEEPRE